MSTKAKTTGFEYLAKRSDRRLLEMLEAINGELFARHGTTPTTEEEITGLETLTSACDELMAELE